MEQKTSFPLVFALWGAGLGAAAQYGKMSVIFDILPGAYPDAGANIGWIVSLVGGVGILFGVIAGVLVARIRYRRALLWALFKRFCRRCRGCCSAGLPKVRRIWLLSWRPRH
jgi:DHA1 family inner membrane transport protein